ncbi:MAG: murein biosynthesis integral membrane protein MurJ [Leptospiraceae bacterium]|nr:murein biosynthesis integral membrane protein MurJ [Leptospiraceae bacterium]
MSTARKSLQLSFFTMGSRVLGLIRDRFQAVLFGTGEIASAWEVAYMLPNMLRNLLAEGVLSQAFIPIYAEAQGVSAERAARASGVVLVFLFFALSMIVLAGVLMFPWLLPIINKGQPNTAMLIELAQILFVFILFASLAAVLMGMQQSHQHYLIPALGPILLNLVFIAGYLGLFWQNADGPSAARQLAWIVVIGGFLQLALQVGWVVYKGWTPHLNLDWRNPALKKVLLLMAPAVLGASMFQLNQLMDILIASWFIPYEVGAIPALRYAHRLIQLPTGIIGVAIATVILPTLSRTLRQADEQQESRSEFTTAIQFSLFLTVPASLGLFILGDDIIRVIYYGGKWDTSSTTETWQALFYFSLGVPFFSLSKILTSSFYAWQDTKSPVRIMMAMVLLNMVLNVILVGPLAQGGIALSTVISSIGSVILQLLWIRRRGLHVDAGRFRRFIGRALTLWILMALLLWLWSLVATPWITTLAIPGGWALFPGNPVQYRAILIVLPAVIIAGPAYLAGAWLLGLEELQAIVRMLPWQRFWRRSVH